MILVVFGIIRPVRTVAGLAACEPHATPYEAGVGVVYPRVVGGPLPSSQPHLLGVGQLEYPHRLIPV